MKFQIITLFPERFHSYFEYGLPSRALKKGLLEIETIPLQDFAEPGRFPRVDDAPYGGGPGMVLQVGPVDRALQAATEKLPRVLFTPRGEVLDQKMVRRFLNGPGYTLISGYYEGVDERIAENLADYQISTGEYVLGSGDLPALCFIEAVSRLIPGYMGSAESGTIESNETELLEYPQYTRPSQYGEWKVPDVLLSGNHEVIAQWRREKSLEITRIRKHGNENEN